MPKALVVRNTSPAAAAGKAVAWERQDWETQEDFELFHQYCETSRPGETPSKWIMRTNQTHDVDETAALNQWATRRQALMRWSSDTRMLQSQIEIGQIIAELAPSMKMLSEFVLAKIGDLQKQDENGKINQANEFMTIRLVEQATKLATAVAQLMNAVNKSDKNTTVQVANVFQDKNDKSKVVTFSNEWNEV